MKYRILTILVALVCYAVGYAGNISVEELSLKPGETKKNAKKRWKLIIGG